MRHIRESRLASRAGRQHGVVGAADVRAAGLDRDAVRREKERGRLFLMFPNAWSVGHKPLTREAWFTAGVLSAGDRSLLDGASACQLYGVFRKRVGKVYVVRPGKAAEHGRLKIRSAKRMPRRCKRKGIPVVPIEEALLGLAASDAGDHDVRRAIRQAQVDKLTTYAKLRRHAERNRGRRGNARFRLLLGASPCPTHSELEDAAVDLVRRYGFEPQINVIVDGFKADMVIDGVIVELDSEEFHDNSIQALDDARKHEQWQANRRTTQSWTWDDVHVTPVRTIRRLHAAVASAA